jgi:hypothetical protein
MLTIREVTEIFYLTDKSSKEFALTFKKIKREKTEKKRYNAFGKPL